MKLTTVSKVIFLRSKPEGNTIQKIRPTVTKTRLLNPKKFENFMGCYQKSLGVYQGSYFLEISDHRVRSDMPFLDFERILNS